MSTSSGLRGLEEASGFGPRASGDAPGLRLWAEVWGLTLATGAAETEAEGAGLAVGVEVPVEVTLAVAVVVAVAAVARTPSPACGRGVGLGMALDDDARHKSPPAIAAAIAKAPPTSAR